jgi:hypothetical protein
MRTFLHRHSLFAALLAAGALARTVAVLGYHPALWFSDALRYAAIGIQPFPDIMRPSGYPLLLLWPLHWAHSFMLVVIVQHLLGLATGVLIYVALLRRRIRRWAAGLAAAPVLLSAYQIQIEHFILSDPLFIFLLAATLTALLWSPSPRWWECAIAGGLLGTAVITRSDGLPLIAAVALWLMTRPGAWRIRLASSAAAFAAFALPVVAYANWFHESYGQYNLTYSQGPFLAARAETFANCAQDSIPVADRWLCTTPGHRPDWYLWSKHEPLHIAGEFTPATDKSGTSFALHVIEAQPVDYALAAWRDVLQNFTAGQTWHPFAFPDHSPASVSRLIATNPTNFPLTSLYRYDPHPSTRLSQPWADVMLIYQRVMVLPPIATAIIVLAGLAGLVLCGEPRGGHGLLPWLMGLILLVFPAATSGYGARYELAAIVPLCMAAALGLAEITGEASLATRLVEAT